MPLGPWQWNTGGPMDRWTMSWDSTNVAGVHELWISNMVSEACPETGTLRAG